MPDMLAEKATEKRVSSSLDTMIDGAYFPIKSVAVDIVHANIMHSIGKAHSLVNHETRSDVSDMLLGTLDVVSRMSEPMKINFMRLITNAMLGHKFASITDDSFCFIVDRNTLSSMKLLDKKRLKLDVASFAMIKELAHIYGELEPAILPAETTIVTPQMSNKSIYTDHLANVFSTEGAANNNPNEKTPFEALMEYASETIAANKGWEGELIGAVEIKKRHQISAGSLKHYRDSNQIIAFRHGATKFRYPAEQFVRSGIVPGIGKLKVIIKTPGETWRWMVAKSPYLGGKRPVEMLKADRISDVIEAAHKQYDL